MRLDHYSLGISVFDLLQVDDVCPPDCRHGFVAALQEIIGKPPRGLEERIGVSCAEAEPVAGQLPSI